MFPAKFRKAASAYIGTNDTGALSSEKQGGFLDIQYPPDISLRIYMNSLEMMTPSQDLDQGGNISLPLENIVLLLDLIKSRYNGSSSQQAAADDFLDLFRYLTQALLPPKSFAHVYESPSGESTKFDTVAVANFQAFSYHGLVCLSILLPIIRDNASDEEKLSLRVCLAVFSDPKDPWTSQPVFFKSSDMLRLMTERGQAKINFCNSLLEENIKPAFRRTRQPKLTSQARRAPHQVQVFTGSLSEDPESNSWRHESIYVSTLLRYVLLQLAELGSSFIETKWPIFVPPILAMIDDPSASYKVRGCRNLEILLLQKPTIMLERTGLGQVFEDALTPCLTYLPTLTEESTSVTLLSQAYPALIELAEVRYAKPEQRSQRVRSLGQIMRDGICRGFANAGEHARIAQTLLVQMNVLIQRLNVDLVKYLKHAVRICCSVLANPFGASYPPLQLTCLEALQNIIVVSWPRLKVHKAEIIRALKTKWSTTGSSSIQVSEESLLRSRISRCHRLLDASATPLAA